MELPAILLSCPWCHQRWKWAILHGLLKSESEIKPEKVTGDTHAQNAVVFGLAHLLGIRLVLRIRDWKDLNLYSPTPESHYEHIDALFSDDVNWDLIETHLLDLLRIVLSVKTGTITASTILGKLNTYSQKTSCTRRSANWGGSFVPVFAAIHG